MKRLIIKSFLLLLPFLLLSGYFIIEDPMKIIHNTKDPTSPGVLMNDRLFVARHLIKSKAKYNAFILGSSRSKSFKTAAWAKHLPSSSKSYHIGVNDETLYGIERKLNYLDSSLYKPKHVLLLIDHRLLSLTSDQTAHIFREYYGFTGETAASYYQRFLIAFLNPDFLKAYINYLRYGTIGKSANYLWDPGFTFSENNGDIFYSRMDIGIANDSLKFYKDNAATFHNRRETTSKPLMNAEAKRLMSKIKKIFDKNNTSYKIIITPNYDFVKLHPSDVTFLEQFFRKEHVVDFSGSNEMTESLGNYYEHKHFKPYIANRVMAISYSSQLRTKTTNIETKKTSN